MRLLSRWRAGRDHERRAQSYVSTLLAEPAADDVSWLAKVATGGDGDHALWELRYARRALGLITAELDALDDRTASSVGRLLAASLRSDPRVAPAQRVLAERQFNARLGAYRDAVTARTGSGAPEGTRLARILFAFCGTGAPGDRDPRLEHAAEQLSRYLRQTNQALRDSFGTATLPESIPPSQLTGR